LVCPQTDECLAIQSARNTWRTRGLAYNDIDGFVQVYDDTIVVDDGHGRDGALREHVDDVKDGSVEPGGGDGVIGVGSISECVWRRSNICADSELAQGLVELRNVLCALDVD